MKVFKIDDLRGLGGLYMIVKKQWANSKPIFKGSCVKTKYVYEGYFLLGLIPIYIVRVGY